MSVPFDDQQITVGRQSGIQQAALLFIHICSCSSCNDLDYDTAQAAHKSAFSLSNGRPADLSSTFACCGGRQGLTCGQCQARGQCGAA